MNHLPALDLDQTANATSTALLPSTFSQEFSSAIHDTSLIRKINHLQMNQLARFPTRFLRTHLLYALHHFEPPPRRYPHIRPHHGLLCLSHRLPLDCNLIAGHSAKLKHSGPAPCLLLACSRARRSFLSDLFTLHGPSRLMTTRTTGRTVSY